MTDVVEDLAGGVWTGSFGQLGGLGSLFGGGGDDDLAEQIGMAGQAEAAAYIRGAELSAEAQREALDYIKSIEALPQQYREAALRQLAGGFILPGGYGTTEQQQQLIEQARQSPLYQAILGGREAGEESILRSAAATGGLRSGNVQEALYDYNTQLQNQALLQSYNQQLGQQAQRISGLQGLAGIPSYAPQIAQQTAGIGQTLGQGQIGAGQAMSAAQIAALQAQQSQQQQGIGNLMGLGQLGILAYGAGMFSDRRLKKNIKRIGTVNKLPWYSFDWNTVANKMGLNGECQGFMADEVFDVRPDAVVLKDLFMFVLYPKLGGQNA